MRLPALLVAALFVVAGQLRAQSLARSSQAKPAVFNNLPSRIPVEENSLESIFTFDINDSFTIQLHPSLELKAIVMDKVFRPGGAVSVNLKASNYQDIVFNFSRFIVSGKKVQYAGRALHPGFSDAMVLKQKDRQYYFEVMEVKKLMNE